MVVATIPGEGAFMKNSVTRGFTAALRRVNRSISALISAVSRYLISAIASGASNTLLILASRSIILLVN
jgi:CRISPR/Cas system-associated protein Csx1